MNFEIRCSLYLVLVSIAFLCFPIGLRGEQPVHYKNAVSAIDKIKDWSTWLTGLETATIGAMGVIARDSKLKGVQRRRAFFALLFLSASLLLSVWMVASLPNITLQLGPPDSIGIGNDIYEHQYQTATHWLLAPALFLQHTYFMLGATCFAVLVYSVYSVRTTDAAGV